MFREMYELRELRRTAELGQRDFAALLSVPLETLRTCDSGRRQVPKRILRRATEAVVDFNKRKELISLAQLARELNVHVRTLQAAARTGRLETHFSVRSVFGRPVGSASVAAGQRFLRMHYRRFSGQAVCPLPLPNVPGNYDDRLTALRRRLGLSQNGLAKEIGAAGKAVIYQWESRKRHPSPVLWSRVLNLANHKSSPRRY